MSWWCRPSALLRRSLSGTGGENGIGHGHANGRGHGVSRPGLLEPLARLRFHFNKMGLTLDEIKKIAELSRLELSPEEEATYQQQLGRVVDYIDQLKAFATHPSDAAARPQPEADDTPREGEDTRWFVANAPEALDRFLLVPQVKASERG